MSNLPYLVIPAYQPDTTLVSLVSDLRAASPLINIIVVNDGSDAQFQILFDQVAAHGAIVLNHEKNKGKGAALKTAFTYHLQNSPNTSPGVITADADGQHCVENIIHLVQKLVDHPTKLHLGVREFSTKTIPWRSKFGNTLTRFLFKHIYRVALQDTQTGLRAIPRHFLNVLISSPQDRYEFEFDMLVKAAKQQVPISEHPIETIYEPGNPTSHFNPIIDSLKIYFVFFRYTFISLCSAAVDFLIFSLFFWLSGGILLSIVSGRLISGSFNFFMNKNFSFKHNQNYVTTAQQYIILATGIAAAAYILIKYMVYLGINVYLAKLFAETLLFITSFCIQRYFIFNNKI